MGRVGEMGAMTNSESRITKESQKEETTIRVNSCPFALRILSQSPCSSTLRALPLSEFAAWAEELKEEAEQDRKHAAQ
jgi:galactokinase